MSIKPYKLKICVFFLIFAFYKKGVLGAGKLPYNIIVGDVIR